MDCESQNDHGYQEDAPYQAELGHSRIDGKMRRRMVWCGQVDSFHARNLHGSEVAEKLDNSVNEIGRGYEYRSAKNEEESRGYSAN
jgi:hypothetical protein